MLPSLLIAAAAVFLLLLGLAGDALMRAHARHDPYLEL
ncbi:hypothetical protein RAN3_2507 [plant metagenome]|uniref:Uncharacterized protein n=1 Tax=plant metagenome TaxID=1297885 RepID=A0A484U1R7_9ZZZZ